MPALISGFSLGLSLILAIGAQNAFVLRQGLRREHVFLVCLVCAVSDAVLIAFGVGGLDVATRLVPPLAPLLKWGGVAFLGWYGLRSWRAAFTATEGLNPADAPPRPLGPTLATCLALTWLNPHVYLDTVLLIGSISTRFPGARLAFAGGAMASSVVFFFALGYGAALLRPLFARALAWRILDGVVGATMWIIAARLAFE